MSSPRDPHPAPGEATFVPAPAGPDVTVAPTGEYQAEGPSGSRTAPSRGTQPTGGSAPTAYDVTSAVPPVATPPADSDVTRTAASAPAVGGRPSPAGVAVDRYVLRGFHARGGLGEVHRALDLELDREVAFKRIQSAYADDPDWREKFVDEARVTARLDHPGVVPVFGLVADGYGRPCYAMRFVAGDTLRQQIDRYHGTGKHPQPPVPPLADPDARRHAFRQLLQRFVAVCQAVGYAHTRGVVHRDLKPANVMVGEFGETLVVDWGLARNVGGPTTAPATRAADPTAGTVTLPVDPEEKTTAGKAVGTPAFMPPEQALGLPEAWPSADVFGLGAVLFNTLTGRAPYTGGDASATIQLAQKADYPRPRAVSPDVPPALEAICLKAMAPAPGDRYESALDLAADVERWLSDEPVTAYQDPLPARAARWARRHPARVAGVGSALLAGLAAAIAIALVVQSARTRAEDDNRKLEAAQAETTAALAKEEQASKATRVALVRVIEEEARTREQKTAAEASQKSAEVRFGLAQSAFGTLVGDVQDELDDRAGTQILRASVLTRAMEGLDALCESAEDKSDHAEAHRLRAWARLQRGDVNRTLGRTRAALADYQVAAAAAAALEAAKQAPAPRAGVADAHDRLADAFLTLGEVRRAGEAAEVARARRAVRPKSAAEADATAGTLDRVAAVALEAGQTHAATGAAAAALELRRGQLAADDGPAARRGLAAALDRDAEVKLRVGNTAAAAAAADEAVGYRREVAAKLDRSGPKREWAASLALKADVAAERADLATELKARTEAAAVLAKLAAADPLDAAARAEAAVARGRLGAARLRAGDLTAARADTTAARAAADAFAAVDPTSARAARAVGLTRWDQGAVLLKAADPAAAVAEFVAAAVVFEKLEAEQPDSARARREAAEARERLAAARVAAGSPAAAVGPLAASVEARKTAADADPANARAVRDLAVALGRLADAYLAVGNYAAAEDAAAAAATRLRARAAADPDNLSAARDLAGARSAWARVTAVRGEQTATLLLLNQALDGFRDVAEKDASSTAAAEERAAALARLADALADADLPEFQLEAERAALTLREKAAAELPDSPVAQLGLVASRRRLGEAMTTARRFDEAEKQFAAARAVLDRFPDSPVLAAEARAVAEGAEVLAGVKAAATNRDAVRGLPPAVRARVLAAVAEDGIRRNHPVEATWAAGLLGEHARGPDDLYRAALVYARAASRAGAPAGYGDSAVALLARAADAGFRNPDLLRARWWDGLRTRDAFKAVEARLATPPSKQ